MRVIEKREAIKEKVCHSVLKNWLYERERKTAWSEGEKIYRRPGTEERNLDPFENYNLSQKND